MYKDKIKIDVECFPKELRVLFHGADVYDSSGRSNAKVLYLDSGYYVKIDDKHELEREAALGKMFCSRGLGAEIVCYISEDKDYLVTREVEGHDLTHYLDDPKRLCAVMAEVLRTLHSLDASGFPISSRVERYFDSADSDLSGGYYDRSVLMDRYPIAFKREAWDIMQANKHRLNTNALIHGDFCLPNVILNDWKFRSFIDFNMAGLGDKHIDLYWAIWSLQHNLNTAQYSDRFLDAYSRENFDEEMLKVIAAFEVFG